MARGRISTQARLLQGRETTTSCTQTARRSSAPRLLRHNLARVVGLPEDGLLRLHRLRRSGGPVRAMEKNLPSDLTQPEIADAAPANASACAADTAGSDAGRAQQRRPRLLLRPVPGVGGDVHRLVLHLGGLVDDGLLRLRQLQRAAHGTHESEPKSEGAAGDSHGEIPAALQSEKCSRWLATSQNTKQQQVETRLLHGEVGDAADDALRAGLRDADVVGHLVRGLRHLPSCRGQGKREASDDERIALATHVNSLRRGRRRGRA